MGHTLAPPPRQGSHPWGSYIVSKVAGSPGLQPLQAAGRADGVGTAQPCPHSASAVTGLTRVAAVAGLCSRVRESSA